MPDIEETKETESKATETAKEADKYYNTWITITLDFGTEGTAVLDKSIVKDQGLSKFFVFSTGLLK